MFCQKEKRIARHFAPVVLLILAGCGQSTPPVFEVSAEPEVAAYPAHMQYYHALSGYYQEMADESQARNISDGSYYRVRQNMSAQGRSPLLTAANTADAPLFAQFQGILVAGAATLAPYRSAQLQAALDCLSRETKTNGDLRLARQCRNRANAAMIALRRQFPDAAPLDSSVSLAASGYHDTSIGTHQSRTVQVTAHMTAGSQVGQHVVREATHESMHGSECPLQKERRCWRGYRVLRRIRRAVPVRTVATQPVLEPIVVTHNAASAIPNTVATNIQSQTVSAVRGEQLGAVFFGMNRYDIPVEGLDTIQRIADQIRSSGVRELEIVGYIDSGSEAQETNLAVNRAHIVKRSLESNLKNHPIEIQIRDDSPQMVGFTPAFQRRVEFILKR